MATQPRKRRSSALHALPAATERRLARVERYPRLRTLDELLAGLRSIAPEVFSESRPVGEPKACSDRQERIRLLAARAESGEDLFNSDDAVFLPPDEHGGRHHRKRHRH